MTTVGKVTLRAEHNPSAPEIWRAAMASLVKVIAYRSSNPIIHLAGAQAQMTLCGRRAVWDVREPYVRATCEECKALSTAR